jgi:O-antigen ligase
VFRLSHGKSSRNSTLARAPVSVQMNRISSIVLFDAVALAPLPFGSVAPDAIAFWCIILGIGLLFVSPRRLQRAHFALLGGTVVIVLAYAFVLHEQLSPHPFIASPDPLWRSASAALGTQLEPLASIARNQPFFSLGAPLAAVLAMVCSLIVCADRIRAHQLLKVVAWSGAAYAAFGIIAFLIDPTKTLWRDSAYPKVLTSTFVNANTAAAYFGSCSVIWLLIACEGIRRRMPEGRIDWIALLRKIFPDRQIAGPFFMFLLCLIAMFLTESRGGVLASLIALIVAFLGIFHRRLGPIRAWLVALTVLGSAALLFLQTMGAGVSGRLANQGLADEGRLATYRSTLHMIAHHPWFGTGLGTFAWSFPAYRSTDSSMSGTWDRAHDTPLEIAAEVGLPLAGLVVVAWLVALAVLIHGIRVRRRDLVLPVAAFAVSVLALLHSLVDFPLQIPGYAIVVLALAGAGLSQSFAGTARDKQSILHSNATTPRVVQSSGRLPAGTVATPERMELVSEAKPR